jgi:hypothetical protein
VKELDAALSSANDRVKLQELAASVSQARISELVRERGDLESTTTDLRAQLFSATSDAAGVDQLKTRLASASAENEAIREDLMARERQLLAAWDGHAQLVESLAQMLSPEHPGIRAAVLQLQTRARPASRGGLGGSMKRGAESDTDLQCPGILSSDVAHEVMQGVMQTLQGRRPLLDKISMLERMVEASQKEVNRLANEGVSVRGKILSQSLDAKTEEVERLRSLVKTGEARIERLENEVTRLEAVNANDKYERLLDRLRVALGPIAGENSPGTATWASSMSVEERLFVQLETALRNKDIKEAELNTVIRQLRSQLKIALDKVDSKEMMMKGLLGKIQDFERARIEEAAANSPLKKRDRDAATIRKLESRAKT